MSNILFTKKFIAKIRTIIRNFWWTGIKNESTTRCLCLRAWKDICTSKNEGGLGIRNLQAMNQSLLLMTAWRIADNRDTYLYSVLKSKYFVDSSIWRPNVNTPKSVFWASILKVLPILKDHTFYQLSSGQVSIWSTPWCNGWVNIYDSLIIQERNFVYPAQVKDLWIGSQKQWNNHLIEALFQEPLATSIKQTPILHTEDNDLLVWKLTPTGICNTKSAYKACLQRMYDNGEPQPTQVNLNTVHLLKRIWKNKNMLPRIQTFGWRLLRKAIPTGARVGRYSKHISKLCCRCSMEETDVHLFFLCPFARAVWFSFPWCIRIDQVVDESRSITQTLLNILNMNHPYASIENLLTYLWCIWKSRNDCLFNRQVRQAFQIQHMANALNQNMEMLDVLQVATNRSLGASEENHQQEKKELQVNDKDMTQGITLKSDLLINGSKIFTDAAWKTRKIPGIEDDTSTGLGSFFLIHRQNIQEKILIQASSISATPSPIYAEAMSLLLAAQIAEKLNVDRPVFFNDNLTLVKAAAASRISDKQVPWELREQIEHYQKVSRNLDAKIFHINRDLNGISHNCAKQATRQLHSLPIFSCKNSTHLKVGVCPVVSSLSNFHYKGIVLHVVHCI
jgi:hypothetical protein